MSFFIESYNPHWRGIANFVLSQGYKNYSNKDFVIFINKLPTEEQLVAIEKAEGNAIAFFSYEPSYKGDPDRVKVYWDTIRSPIYLLAGYFETADSTAFAVHLSEIYHTWEASNEQFTTAVGFYHLANFAPEYLKYHISKDSIALSFEYGTYILAKARSIAASNFSKGKLRDGTLLSFGYSNEFKNEVGNACLISAQQSGEENGVALVGSHGCTKDTFMVYTTPKVNAVELARKLDEHAKGKPQVASCSLENAQKFMYNAVVVTLND